MNNEKWFYEEIRLTHVNVEKSILKLFIQFDLTTADEIHNALNGTSLPYVSIASSQIRPNKMVLVDFESNLYRGQIIGRNAFNVDAMKILFIDFGYTKDIHVSQVLELKDHVLMNISGQATECISADISLNHKNQTISLRLLREFQEITLMKPAISCEILRVSPLPIVKLYRRKQAVEYILKRVRHNEIVIHKEFATYEIKSTAEQVNSCLLRELKETIIKRQTSKPQLARKIVKTRKNDPEEADFVANHRANGTSLNEAVRSTDYRLFSERHAGLFATNTAEVDGTTRILDEESSRGTSVDFKPSEFRFLNVRNDYSRDNIPRVYDRLNLIIGTDYAVCISHLEPQSFYILLEDTKYQRKDIEKKLLSLSREVFDRPLDDICPGMPCLVRHPELESCLRGVVLSCYGNFHKVRLIDVGRVEIVHHSKLRPITPVLLKWEIQAVYCLLKEKFLSTNHLSVFWKRNDSLRCRVLGRLGDTYVVSVTPTLGSQTDALIEELRTKDTPSPVVSVPQPKVRPIERIIVRGVKCGRVFYCQLNSSLAKAALSEMTSKLQDFYKSCHSRKENNVVPAKGGFVCVKSFINDLFYRGQVIKVTDGECEVFLLDTARLEHIPFSNVFDLVPTFASVPRFAIESVLLDDVVTRDVEDTIAEAICFCELRVKILGVVDGVYRIALTDDDINRNIKDVLYQVKPGHAMNDNGVFPVEIHDLLKEPVPKIEAFANLESATKDGSSGEMVKKSSNCQNVSILDSWKDVDSSYSRKESYNKQNQVNEPTCDSYIKPRSVEVKKPNDLTNLSSISGWGKPRYFDTEEDASKSNVESTNIQCQSQLNKREIEVLQDISSVNVLNDFCSKNQKPVSNSFDEGTTTVEFSKNGNDKFKEPTTFSANTSNSTIDAPGFELQVHNEIDAIASFSRQEPRAISSSPTDCVPSCTSPSKVSNMIVDLNDSSTMTPDIVWIVKKLGSFSLGEPSNNAKDKKEPRYDSAFHSSINTGTTITDQSAQYDANLFKTILVRRSEPKPHQATKFKEKRYQVQSDNLDSNTPNVNFTFPNKNITISSDTSVLVTHIVNPGEIYGQPLELCSERSWLMNELQRHYNTNDEDKAVLVAQIGSGCAIKSLENCVWYRAVVQEILVNRVAVLLVDCGRSELLAKSAMRPLHQRFQQYPVQVHKFVLAGTGSLRSREWTQSEVQEFRSKYLLKEVKMSDLVVNGEEYLVVNMI